MASFNPSSRQKRTRAAIANRLPSQQPAMQELTQDMMAKGVSRKASAYTTVQYGVYVVWYFSQFPFDSKAFPDLAPCIARTGKPRMMQHVSEVMDTNGHTDERSMSQAVATREGCC